MDLYKNMCLQKKGFKKIFENQIEFLKTGHGLVKEGKITIKDLKVGYNKDGKTTYILKGVNMTIYPGQTVCILGKSGCGKSTLLYSILRFFDSVKGTIHFDDVDIYKEDPQLIRSNISYIS